MIKKERLSYIDWLKAIGICLIVAGHMFPSACWPKVLMYSFHVPIFAVVGGLLAKPAKTYKECFCHMGKTALRLLIPYTIWFIIFAYPHLLPEEQIPSVVKTAYVFEDLWKLFLFWENKTIWNAAMWFLPAYFIISMIYPMYLKLTKGSRLASLVVAFAAFATVIILEKKEITINLGDVENVMGARNIIILLGFYAFGHAINGVINDLMRWEHKKWKTAICWLGLVGFVVTAYFTVQSNFVENYKYPAGYYTLSFYSGLFNGMFRFIAYGVLLCLTLVLACGLFPRNKSVELLSGSSFFIMLTHYAFFLDDTFRSLSKQEWVTDLAHSVRDSVFIIVVYLVVLHALDHLFKKFPKVKPFFRILGI